jgi:hypothetical protein
LRRAAKRNPKHEQVLLDAALLCETEPTQENAIKAKDTAYAAAYAAADAAAYAADAYAAYAAGSKPGGSDHILSVFAEEVVEILIQMKAPGCAFLDLATYEAA